jgi:hypothetical protein
LARSIKSEIHHNNTLVLSQIAGNDIMDFTTGYVSILILVLGPYLSASPTIPDFQNTKQQFDIHISTRLNYLIIQ